MNNNESIDFSKDREELLPVELNNNSTESLMIIENNDKNISSVFFLYTFILIIALIIGYNTKPEQNFHRSLRHIIDEENSISLTFRPLSKRNGFIFVYLKLDRFNILNKIEPEPTIFINSATYKNGRLLHQNNHTSSVHFTFPSRKSLSASPVTIYCDSSIDYDTLTFDFYFSNLSSNINTISINTVNGLASAIYFKNFLKFFFTLLEIFYMILTINKYKKESYLSLEQKYTFILLIICLLYNNPLNYFLTVVNRLFKSLFHAAIKVYPIAILSIIRSQYNSKVQHSLTPKIFIFLLLFLFQFIHMQTSEISYYDYFTPVNSKSNIILVFELAINLFYLNWLIVSLFSSLIKAKGFENQRAKLFCGSVFSSLLIYWISIFISHKIKTESQCSIQSFVQIVVSNLFTLLMCYYHWPFEDGHSYSKVPNIDTNLFDSGSDQ